MSFEIYGFAQADASIDTKRMDLAPDGTLLHPHARAVPLKGALIYFDHYWSDRWSSSIGYRITQVRNTSLQAPEAYHRGQYASANLLYADAELPGWVEAIWGRRTDTMAARLTMRASSFRSNTAFPGSSFCKPATPVE